MDGDSDEPESATTKWGNILRTWLKKVRGGGGHRNRNINLAQRLMAAFFKAKEDEVREISIEIEG